MERTALACDIGTSSLKAALIDGQGRVLAQARVRFPETRRAARDWALAFAEACARIKASLAASGSVPFAPEAIVVSGNGPTLVSVDPAGDCGPVLLWNDPIEIHSPSSRHTVDSTHLVGSPHLVDSPHAPETPRSAGTPHSSNTPHPVLSRGPSIFIPRIAAYRDAFAEPYARARWLLSGPECLVWALTGNATTILPDPRFERAYWTKEDLAATGLDGSRLAPFAPIGHVAGISRRTLLRAVGAVSPDKVYAPGEIATPDAGLFPAGAVSTQSAGFLPAGAVDFDAVPEGIPVVSGGPDFVVALIGTGTLSPGKACDRAGTSEGLNVCTALPIAREAIRSLPSVIPGLWNAAYLLPDTGAEFHAWRRATGQDGREYPDIMAEIAASPIVPARGEEIHPGRTLVERIGFSVRRGVEALRAATGPVEEFALSGGQARNATWNQMKADIAGATFALTSTPDGELMGDAVVAFAALGEYGSIEEAARHMVTVARRFEPDAARHRLYTEKYLSHENPTNP